MAIKLHLVTPTSRLLSTNVDELTIPAANGEMGILPGHTPVLTFLGVGKLSYSKDGQTHTMAVQQGFAEIKDDEVTILTDKTITSSDIDFDEAKKEMAEAEKVLSEAELSDEEWMREQVKLAIARTKQEFYQTKK